MTHVKELLKQARTLNADERYEEVLALLSDDVLALSKYNNVNLLVERARAHFKCGQYLQCKSFAERILNIAPKNHIANFYLAIWLTKEKNYTEATKLLELGIDVSPGDAAFYNALGALQKEQRQYEEAIRFYDIAEQLNANFAPTYYNRAFVYYIKEEYSQALKDYEKYLSISKDRFDEIFRRRAADRVLELKNLLKDKSFDNIRLIIEKIKNVLLYSGGLITHYTSLDTAKEIIFNRSFFRLSEGAFLNDSSEGRTLFELFSIYEAISYLPNDIEPEPYAKKPFIGSFVPDNLHDNLTLWRMYGKNNKEEAKGCAIAVDSKQITTQITDNLVLEKLTASADEEDFRFYHVAYKNYGSDDKPVFTIPGYSDEKNNELNSLVKQLLIEVDNFSFRKDITDLKYLFEQLNTIAFLFKSNAYQHEQELRLVVKGLHFVKKIDLNFSPPRVYIDLLDVLPHVKKLTLGPKVDKKEEWASAFYYGISQSDSSNDILPDVYLSHLPFK